MESQLAFLMLSFAGLSVSAFAGQRPYLRTEEQMKTLRSSRSVEAAEKAFVKWKRYVEMSDEETWALVPGPMVYRAKLANRRQGCPNCGRKAFEVGGYYPFRGHLDFWGLPWKAKCPSCGEIFPKNDYVKLYKSGLGPDGLFCPNRGDRSLLFNEEHPDPNDPLHLYGVDDGHGMVDEKGDIHHMIAYYNQWAQWRGSRSTGGIFNALKALSRAYTPNTISHNTLLVNDAGSRPGGKINLFVIEPPLRVIDVSSQTAYEDLETYRRTVALVDVSDTDSYVFDVFRARGGTKHRLSYHGPAQTATVTGISLVKQQTGSFASPDVEFATLTGERAAFYKAGGSTYLYDVARSPAPVDTYYTVDWKCEDLRVRIKEGKEPHLRLHALTPCDEVAIASGDPPQNKKGNPRRLRYLIQSRLGQNMGSQFITVLEPYDKKSFIRQARMLEVEHDGDPNSVAAVAVDLKNGTTDPCAKHFPTNKENRLCVMQDSCGWEA